MSKQRLLFSFALMCMVFVCSCTKEPELYSEHHESEPEISQALPTPVEGHPRLFFTAKDVVSLKQRWNSSDPILSSLKEDIMEQSTKVNSCITAGYPYAAFNRACESNAFLYVVNGDLDAGKKAKQFIMEYMNSLGSNLVVGESEFDLFKSRGANRAVISAAIVYDWCYDLFTERELKELIANVNRIGQLADCKEFYGWPIYPSQMPFREYIVTRWAEEKHPSMLAFGIASYDQDPEIYNLMADHLFNYFVPARNFSYEAQRVFYGSAYSGERMRSDFLTSKLYTAMGMPSPYSEDLNEVISSLTYLERPDGHMIPEGDDWLIDVEVGKGLGKIVTAMLISSEQSKNPFQHAQFKKYWQYVKDDCDAALYMALYSGNVPSDDIANMPLTRYYGSPQGNMIARTSWEMDSDSEQSNSAIVKMDMRRYDYAGHTHRDAGHFYIYYKGPLAIDGGAYTSYGSDHYKNYLLSAYAHNTLLIYDAADVEGDQVSSNTYYTNFDQLKDYGRRVEPIANSFGPDATTPEYSYMKGDIAMAYGARAKEAKRSFVALNFGDESYPGALFVYDRIVTADATTKKWLLHAEEEPAIDGDKVTIVASTQRNANHSGMLTSQLVYPSTDEVTIKTVGGDGQEFTTENGINWASDGDIVEKEAGRYRIEISNNEKGKVQHFLNVLHYKDANDGKAALNATAIESDTFVGATISDRAVLFSESGAKMGGTQTFTIKGDGSFKTLITDLKAGSYKISGQTVNVTEQEACIYVELTAGTHTLKKL